MLEVALSQVPSQTLNITLNEQNCVISIYTLATGLYFDLISNNVQIVSTIICRNKSRLINRDYKGFKGDFTFIDNQGELDPEWRGFGSRYSLIYLEPLDLSLS